MAKSILYCTILQHYSLVKQMVMHKWSNAYFKRSQRWPSAVTDISTCLLYACFMHYKESGVIVLLPLGITKILLFHEWWLTTTVLALTENAAIVRYAKYGFQQRPTWHGSQKPGQKDSFQLFNRTSFYWALWFEHNNLQTQTLISHKDNTIVKILQELHFPFCVEANPLTPLRSLGAPWVIHRV